MLPLARIDELMPTHGRIIELGCGEGVISQYLSRNLQRQLVGIDIDKKRLPSKKQKNLEFKCADITKYKIGLVDGIVISDVLHHINFLEQDELLKRCFSSLGKDGVLVVKEINTQDLIRSKISRFWDFVFYPLDRIYFSRGSDLISRLRKIGFKVGMEQASLLFPGSTNLFVCRK